MTALSSRKKDEGTLVFFLLGIILALPMAAWNGFAISTLWNWFVQPLGVAHLGLWGAAGLSLLIHLTTIDFTLSRPTEKTAAERFSTSCALGLLVPAFALGFGAIYHAL